jgi:hypothetical protein
LRIFLKYVKLHHNGLRFFYFFCFWKIDSEENEVESIFEEEVSENSSDNSVFSSKLNSPFKNLDLEDIIIITIIIITLLLKKFLVLISPPTTALRKLKGKELL